MVSCKFFLNYAKPAALYSSHETACLLNAYVTQTISSNETHIKASFDAEKFFNMFKGDNET